jgi:uncharacterized protein (TIGR00255 family)
MAHTLQSMTGFGHAAGELSPRLAAEFRLTSLNSRFLEVVLRVYPRMETTELEAPVRSVLASRLARGKVTVTADLAWRAREGSAALKLNWEVASLLLQELAHRPAQLELAPLTLRDLAALPGFLETGREMRLDETEQEAFLGLVASASEALVRRRQEEAAALLPQIEREIGELREFHCWLGEVNLGVKDALLNRLRERVRAAVGDLLPPDRLLQEAALLADRSDVSEEVERLGAHLAHLEDLLAKAGPVGKKVDFLLQELLREVNTAGSKCREAGMGERVVAAKASLERLREQCANLE